MLLSSFYQAVDLRLEHEFIDLLLREIKRRKLKLVRTYIYR
ncbi:sporulation histidine kinase inhibitor Sda [Paenibacillus radicibacter]|nr:sporulation histidine kinase inhibitor Sda [Paenibacillus radicibacter]